jgi:glutamine amidotransferase
LKNTVQILRLPSSNTGSVRRALEFLGCKVTEVESSNLLEEGVRTVLPGVGTFASAMAYLREHHFIEGIKTLAEKEMPILGICLGMQILCGEGREGGDTPGIGILSGSVVPIKDISEKKYNTGWRRVSYGLSDGDQDFFFSHGYYASGAELSEIAATTQVNSLEIPAVLQSKKTYGVQYHPELSGLQGVERLREYLDLSR